MRLFKHKIGILSIILLAITTVFSCDSEENAIPRPGLEARFVSSMELRTVAFTNISNDATSYSWDFGNGTGSTQIDPIVTFENGIYTVTLTAYDGKGNSDTYQDTLVIDVDICTDETAENLNPSNGDLNWTFLTTNGDATFDAFGDIGGSIVGNPVFDGINTSCNVYKYEKFAGCQTWSGTGIALSSPINFSTTTNKTFKM